METSETRLETLHEMPFVFKSWSSGLQLAVKFGWVKWMALALALVTLRPTLSRSVWSRHRAPCGLMIRF